MIKSQNSDSFGGRVLTSWLSMEDCTKPCDKWGGGGAGTGPLLAQHGPHCAVFFVGGSTTKRQPAE